jgi:hypothetical protein
MNYRNNLSLDCPVAVLSKHLFFRADAVAKEHNPYQAPGLH